MDFYFALAKNYRRLDKKSPNRTASLAPASDRDAVPLNSIRCANILVINEDRANDWTYGDLDKTGGV
jgi:hypothetical protein